MADESDPCTTALIALHAPLERQGPGDTALARRLLETLAPRLPAAPRVADLGCGAGAGALELRRPLLVPGGCAVVSELSWFADPPPEPARAHGRTAYPAMGREHENRERATRAGYSVLRTERPSSDAWWASYDGPLRARIDAMRDCDDPAMRSVIRETEREIERFQRCHASYGYTFYVLERV